MKTKIFSFALLAAAAAFCVASKAEARTHFSLNLGALFQPPVHQHTYVVEHYPCCGQPVYMVPTHVAPNVVYMAPRPYPQTVIVQPAPRVRPYGGFSIGWHS